MCAHLWDKSTEGTRKTRNIPQCNKGGVQHTYSQHELNDQLKVFPLMSIQRVNETKSWFFEKFNKIGKPLPRMTKLRKVKTQINKIRDANEETNANESRES
jgi:hypothetical protein